MDQAERSKLLKFVGMFGSAFQGERDNALSLATKALKRHGLSWEQLISGAGGGYTQGDVERAWHQGRAAGLTEGRAESSRASYDRGYRDGQADASVQGEPEPNRTTTQRHPLSASMLGILTWLVERARDPNFPLSDTEREFLASAWEQNGNYDGLTAKQLAWVRTIWKKTGDLE